MNGRRDTGRQCSLDDFTPGRSVVFRNPLSNRKDFLVANRNSIDNVLCLSDFFGKKRRGKISFLFQANYLAGEKLVSKGNDNPRTERSNYGLFSSQLIREGLVNVDR